MAWKRMMEAAMRDLTEDEVLGAIQSSASLEGRIKLTYESGPYDIDRPTNVAMIFERTVIDRSARQSFRIGPAGDRSSSHSSISGELRSAAQRAMRKNTVEGIPGTPRPTKPSAMQTPQSAT